jgi:hypothetical protein
MGSWLVALAASYFFFVRPMLRGRGHRATTESPTQDTELNPQDTELNPQVAELREELRALRAQDALDSGRYPAASRRPPGT